MIRVLSLALVLGCSGDDPPGPSADVAAAAPAGFDAAVLAAAWPVRLADDAARAPFENNAGWVAVFQREYGVAMEAFAADRGDGRGLARLHVEHAAFYLEAARLAANATRHVYGTDRQPEDPPSVDYLVGVAQAVLGDCAAAAAALGTPGAQSVATGAEGRAVWSAWASAPGCPAPLDDPSAARLIGAPGAVAPGTRPVSAPLPHHSLPLGADGGAISAADPAALLLLARWHEAAARAVVPAEDAPLVELLLAPYRLGPAVALAVPAEAPPVDVAWLFASGLLAPADVPFLAAARQQGVAALAAWSGRSPLAAALAPAVVDGKLVPDKVIDQSFALGTALEEAMAGGGRGEQGFHRPFADIARVGVLRAGAVVASAAGEERDAGILRINALDRSIGTAADPVFLISLAAWDAGNRNPLRAQELLHGLLSSFPAVEAARPPLDALQIRLARTAAPATAVH